MHIRIIHQYFRTPEQGGALRTYYIARYLIKKGHKVSVITAGNSKGYKLVTSEDIEIHYLPVYYSNHLSFLSRVHAFWLFVRKSIRLLHHLPNADLNYILTTPLSTGLIGIWGKRFQKVPYIFEVGDIWPEAPIQLGVIKNPLLKMSSRWFEKQCYSHARILIGLSPEISTHIASLYPKKTVYTITNMSNTTFFHPTPAKDPKLESKYGLNGDKVICYIGTIGMANHLEFLISSFQNLPANIPVTLIIMGSGAHANEIHKMVEDRQIQRIQFLSPGNLDQVKEVLSISDAVYVSFDSKPILSSGSPNKLFDGLAAGKMIIINFHGWLQELIESEKCGIYCDPDDENSFEEKLLPILLNDELLDQYKLQARQLAERSFTPEKQLEKLDRLLREW